MMSDIAHTVSSMGVCGSGRWQKSRSTKSSPKRSRQPSMAWSRYLRFRVLRVFTPSVRPQYTLVETT